MYVCFGVREELGEGSFFTEPVGAVDLSPVPGRRQRCGGEHCLRCGDVRGADRLVDRPKSKDSRRDDQERGNELHLSEYTPQSFSSNGSTVNGQSRERGLFIVT